MWYRSSRRESAETPESTIETKSSVPRRQAAAPPRSANSRARANLLFCRPLVVGCGAQTNLRGDPMSGYRWFRAGALNPFFALMFDNVANLVILSSLLIGAFHFPKDIVLYRMVPGTAVGVLVGDLIYAWIAGRVARRTVRGDTTAMPLGINAPSVFGMSFAVLGPAYLLTGDAWLSWKMAMAVTVLVGLVQMGLVLGGNAVRAAVPRAALLGSIAGAGLALIALLPLLKIVAHPIVGFV